MSLFYLVQVSVDVTDSDFLAGFGPLEDRFYVMDM